MKKYYKLALALAAVIFAWVIGFCIWATYDGLTDNLKKSDVAVVLGNEVLPSGKPSQRLAASLKKTIELYKQGYFEKIIVSGGIGKSGFKEAEIMKNYLVNNGIPLTSIIMDSNGNNTFLTAQNTQKIMKENGFTSVMAISQFYHMSRIELAFSQVGIKDIAAAHADYFEWRDIFSLPREFFGYYAYAMGNAPAY